MGKIYYTADLHFFHTNIIRLSNRPYNNVEEMNNNLIENFNSVVKDKNDEVYILGDFSFKIKDRKVLLDTFNKLNGRKHLVIGNHDHEQTLSLPWSSEPANYKEILDNGTRIILFHYGMRVWNHFFRNSIHLYGHSHDRLETIGNSCDVGVDSWNYKPVSLDEIKLRIQSNPSYNPEISQEEADTKKTLRNALENKHVI